MRDVGQVRQGGVQPALTSDGDTAEEHERVEH